MIENMNPLLISIGKKSSEYNIIYLRRIETISVAINQN